MNRLKSFIILEKSKTIYNIWTFFDTYRIKHTISYVKSKRNLILYSSKNYNHL